MKNLIFSVAFILVSVVSFSQVNVGFAKAGNMKGGEGMASVCIDDALARFYDGAQNPVVGKFMAEKVSIAMNNAGQTFDGRSELKSNDLQWVLGWLKNNLKDTTELHISIYRIPKGNYTFETLTKKSDGSWVLGQQITRPAHENEWVLEWFDVKIASSWCLNTFPTVGKVIFEANVAKPKFNYTTNSNVHREENITFHNNFDVITSPNVVYVKPKLVQVQVLKTRYDECGRRAGIGTAYDQEGNALIIEMTMGEFLNLQEYGGMPVITDAPQYTGNRSMWGRNFTYFKI